MACCLSVETSTVARPTPAHLAQQVRKVHARGAVALPDIQLHNGIGEGVDSVADASIGEDGVQGDVQLKVQSNQPHTLGDRQGGEQECFAVIVTLSIKPTLNSLAVMEGNNTPAAVAKAHLPASHRIGVFTWDHLPRQWRPCTHTGTRLA